MAYQAQPFNGNLRQNDIFSAIYNMIISQEVFGNIVKGTYGSLADLFKTDGGLYGDNKLFYSVKLGHVDTWSNDSEASNLLALNRPDAPNCQSVAITEFRKIWTTVDNFLSKRAFGTEGAFGQFNSVILGTLRDVKRVYEAKLMNVAVGTIETATGSQTQTVTLVTAGTSETPEQTEARNRLDAQLIAKKIADVFVDLKDVSANYNDLQYERSYDESDFVVVWNADFYNKITKIDLPTIFHKDIVDRLGEYVLPAYYFGTVSSLTTSAANARAIDEMKISTTYYRPGAVVPTGSTVTANSTYTVNSKIICKIVHKDAIKFMSAFETESEFWNPRSLTTNHYLIYGFSKPQDSRLKEFPFITIKTA